MSRDGHHSIHRMPAVMCRHPKNRQLLLRHCDRAQLPVAPQHQWERENRLQRPSNQPGARHDHSIRPGVIAGSGQLTSPDAGSVWLACVVYWRNLDLLAARGKRGQTLWKALDLTWKSYAWRGSDPFYHGLLAVDKFICQSFQHRFHASINLAMSCLDPTPATRDQWISD